MMRLIDADALIEDIMEHSASYFADDFAHEWVDKQPTIEPERKKGKWRPAFDGKFRGGAYWFNCSECNHMVVGGLGYGNFFCENCGADMREGSEQE